MAPDAIRELVGREDDGEEDRLRPLPARGRNVRSPRRSSRRSSPRCSKPIRTRSRAVKEILIGRPSGSKALRPSVRGTASSTRAAAIDAASLAPRRELIRFLRCLSRIMSPAASAPRSRSGSRPSAGRASRRPGSCTSSDDVPSLDRRSTPQRTSRCSSFSRVTGIETFGGEDEDLLSVVPVEDHDAGVSGIARAGTLSPG